jgi:phosphoribosylformylglycinamidine synthase subunit PurQ / glutaminase
VKAGIVVFPGSNREGDMARALEQASGRKPTMLWHADTGLPDLDLIVLPGGFSHGDYLRCGAMAARSPIMPEVIKAAQRGVRVLGVCNGFQILTETGLLPGALMRNANLKFACRFVKLRVENNATAFTQGYNKGDVIQVVVAHGDGNYFADEATLNKLEQEDRVAFRYAEGTNPNGAIRDIAGIFNESKTVLGLMPHPENVVGLASGGDDGKRMFAGLVKALA